MLRDRVTQNIGSRAPSEVEAYGNSNLAIFKPKTFVFGESTFDSYHFLIPKENVPSLIIEKKRMDAHKNHIFSINPGQSICVIKDKNVVMHTEEINYLALFIDKQKINDLSKEIFNKSEIYFENENNFFNIKLSYLLNLFMSECTEKQVGFQFILESIVLHISIEILRDLNSNLPYLIEKRRYSSRIEINKAIDYLWENTDDEFSLKNLCKISNLSPYYFLRLFKDVTGKTPYEYYMDIKINKAVELLKSGKYSITEISYMLGFSSNSHFSTVFRNRKGLTLSIFMKSYK